MVKLGGEAFLDRQPSPWFDGFLYWHNDQYTIADILGHRDWFPLPAPRKLSRVKCNVSTRLTMNTAIPLHPDTDTPDLRSWWMPFTHNRLFKSHPRLISGARGAYFQMTDGRRLFDCLSGLWCSPLGHSHPTVVAAVQRQVENLDFSPSFQMGHPAAFTLATRIAALAGRPQDRVFFVNSGSEAVDTSLKIAVAYHRLRGEASRTRIIGRERGYHGVGLEAFRSEASPRTARCLPS